LEVVEMDFVLVPGFWLGGWAWDEVAQPLRDAGHRVWQVTLPGLASPEDERAGISLDDHIEHVVDLLTENQLGSAVLVGHSGAGSVVYGATDRCPSRVAMAIYVDSGPLPDGASIVPAIPDSVIEMPLPSWEELEARGNSVEGLSDAVRELFRRRAVPQPAGPARDPLKLSDPGRLDVPTVLVNCSMPTAKVVELIAAGNPWFAELANLSVRHTELPTGHWPMFSRPKDLAELLLEVVAA
jgi:pimeloyl-ACP methyl ester carboxylesterase